MATRTDRADTTRAPEAEAPSLERRLDEAVRQGSHALYDRQRADGHWCFELEADCTIPAELILMMHFVDELDEALMRKLAVYLRMQQGEHGGWPLYWNGDLDVSASVKAYWALKLAGDAPDEEHMERAREAILARGGAARSNVFTRIAMALFGEVPWRATPMVPVEIMLLPRWFPFHLDKVSYWTRTVVVPLAILCSRRARAEHAPGDTLRELFVVPPEEERDWFPVRSKLNRLFLWTERALRVFEPLIPGFVRRRATRKAEAWILERLNGTEGLGAIFPAMVNAYEALILLGYPEDHAARRTAREAIQRLVVEHDDWAYCQPCVSPVWDTALAALALLEVRKFEADVALEDALTRASSWLAANQVLDGPADWRSQRPELAPGGWPFQYQNGHYPDLDDTAVAAWALFEFAPRRYAEPVRRAADWVRGMQSRNGGFGAFDADNTHYVLNEIPFADHGALLDPPTADVSGRCATLFGLLARAEDGDALDRSLDYLFAEQEEDGAWFGRWGTNYVYGTWSVLMGLEQVDDPRVAEALRRAVRWLEDRQQADGGWGESNASYATQALRGRGIESTPFQTAWALLGLLAAGQRDSPAVERAVQFLLQTQGRDGLWHSDEFTAPGFPRVFYLRYHGYTAYFPLWALARYRRERRQVR